MIFENLKKPSKKSPRKYTLMIVPHFEKQIRSFCLPARTIKSASVCLLIGVLIATGAFFNYANNAKMTLAEKNELRALRESNLKKQTQIEEMAKDIAVLQHNMNRLNQLDKEVRTILADLEPGQEMNTSEQQPLSEYSNNQGGPLLKPTAEEVVLLIKDLESKMSQRHNKLSNLKESAQQAAQIAAATPSIWPTNGEVTSAFGWRNSPWGNGEGWHPGIDIANDPGTPIVATANGVVTESGYASGYGNMIVINHGNGIETVYGHNARLLIQEGQSVQKGQLIAYMGSSGFSTGPHVHYEVRVNKTAVNPSDFL